MNNNNNNNYNNDIYKEREIKYILCLQKIHLINCVILMQNKNRNSNISKEKVDNYNSNNNTNNNNNHCTIHVAINITLLHCSSTLFVHKVTLTFLLCL